MRAGRAAAGQSHTDGYDGQRSHYITVMRRTLRTHAVCGTCASAVPEPWKKSEASLCTSKSWKGMGVILVHRSVWVVVRNVAGRRSQPAAAHTQPSRRASRSHMRMVVRCVACLLLRAAAAVTCGLGAQQQARAMQMATRGNVATTTGNVATTAHCDEANPVEACSVRHMCERYT